MARITIEEIGRLPLPGTAVPGSIAFAPDGSGITFLHDPGGALVRSLWWLDLASGERMLLAGPSERALDEASLSDDERLRRERTRTSALGVTEYAWARDAMTLVVPIARQVLVATGDALAAGARTLAALDGASGAVPSPDGRLVAAVRDGEAWVAPVGGTGEAVRLTHDAAPGTFNGLPEYVAAEELGRFEGLWWSGDSRRLAVAHVDERGIEPYVIPHPAAERPTFEEHRYPFAGGPNAVVSLRIVEADGSASPREVALGMEVGDYLARVVAEPSGGWLVAVLPRAQRELRWLRVSAAGEATTLWTEPGDPWVNLDDLTRVLADGRILRATEETGFRHLELRAPDGAFLHRLTEGPWLVTDVACVDEARSEVWCTGTADGATERHLYRVPLEPAAPTRVPERLTTEPGWHEVAVSRDGNAWVDTWSSLERSPTVVLHDRDSAGQVLHGPEMIAGDDGLPVPQLLELRADDGETPLHAAFYPPAGDAATRSPCVVWVYGGPHVQSVKKAWELTVHGLRRYLAQQGVAVLVVDNRGSAFRGLAFEAGIGRHLGSVEVDDQAAAVRQLAERGLIDPARVAITGGSYGGFMTIRCMQSHPGLFSVGVAVAPVTDWHGYDTAYTERYLGTPADEPEAYRRSSALPLAGALEGDLLLIHGAVDENVHLRHSIRLVDALQAAGRDVELVVLPGDRHRVRSPSGLLTRDRRTVEHLLRGLGVAARPAPNG
ncbi:MAG TPA: DPP IV N-terminal domain-containing protein [Candidatus Limnocylindria bacterium]